MAGRTGWTRWSAHVASAEREGKSLAQYAREHRLSVGSLYMARHLRQRDRGSLNRRVGLPRAGAPKSHSSVSPFVPVKVCAPLSANSTPRLLARLPNGVVLECSLGGEHGALIGTLLQYLSGLPCSD